MLIWKSSLVQGDVIVENSLNTNAVLQSDDSNVCMSKDDPSCKIASLERPLKPSDIPGPVVFSAFDKNETILLPGGYHQELRQGKVSQVNSIENPDLNLVDFAVLPSAINRTDVEEILSLLRQYNDWDDDPDTVDGMTSHEMFVWTPGMYEEGPTMKYRDSDPNFLPARKVLRAKLDKIMQPYLDNVITPLVHQRYPDACTSKGEDRYCKPCYSLVRQYKHGLRQTHDTHNDGHAIVTVVVSLSDYDVEYRGGLYVATGYGQKEHVALNKGDGVMHQSSLLHGVKVYDLPDTPEKTERWSWILWYRDSSTCEDHGHEWFADCAEKGDILCKELHSTKVGAVPGISEEETVQQILQLNIDAANGGSGTSALKVARAYLKNLPSKLDFDLEKAKYYYQLAIQSYNPNGYFGLAQILLTEVISDYKSQPFTVQQNAWKDPRVMEAIKLLEKAAYFNHPFAKFNLGVVYTFGYNNGIVDAELAGEWFEDSGIPEGYYVASNHAKNIGDTTREKKLMQRAKDMGYFQPWRAQARQSTGSGGAGGVDMNLPWPPSFDGRSPPRI